MMTIIKSASNPREIGLRPGMKPIAPSATTAAPHKTKAGTSCPSAVKSVPALPLMATVTRMTPIKRAMRIMVRITIPRVIRPPLAPCRKERPQFPPPPRKQRQNWPLLPGHLPVPIKFGRKRRADCSPRETGRTKSEASRR